MANDLGVNGVAPWYRRPGLPATAHWIWTSQSVSHDHVFCRYTQYNGPVNCPAAQAQYWEDHPEVKARRFPAWQHYEDIGEELGFNWNSELCNFCHANDVSGNIGSLPGNQGGGAGADENPYSYESSMNGNSQVCTNKCVGKHDAAARPLGGDRSGETTWDAAQGQTTGRGQDFGAHAPVVTNGPLVMRNIAGHYGLGFADFQGPTDSLTFNVHSCNAGIHHMSVAYTLQSDDPPRPLSVTVNGQVATASLSFPATGSWSEWGKVLTKVTLFSGQNSITLTALGNRGANLDYIELLPQVTRKCWNCNRRS